MLASAGRRGRIAVVAGLNERAGGQIYNSAVVISPAGKLLHVHRKINLLLDVAPMYSVGDRLGVKAAGGIRSFADAVAMVRAGASRIGTSSTRRQGFFWS